MATARKTETLGDQWMSIVEAARVLGMSRLGVLSLTVKGVLEGQHVANRNVISRASVEKLLAERAA
jgi:hypothetical protein